MARPLALVTAALVTLPLAGSLVGCQLLGRSGTASAPAELAGAAATPEVEAELAHARPWSVAWVRRGGDDLFVDHQRGVLVSGGNVYDDEQGLYRGRPGPEVIATLADGRSIALDAQVTPEGEPADKLLLTLRNADGDPIEGRSARLGGELLARQLVAGGRALATVEREGALGARLVVRSAASLDTTLSVPLPGDWRGLTSAQLAEAGDGRLVLSLPQGAHFTPQLAVADIDGSVMPLDLPYEGRLVALAHDGRTVAIAAGEGLELRDLTQGTLLHRVASPAPGAAAFSPNGTALALVAPDDEGHAELRVLRADPQRRAWTETYRGPQATSTPALAFSRSGDQLWVADGELLALRPGGDRQRAPLDYGTTLPADFAAQAAPADRPERLTQLVYGPRDAKPEAPSPQVWITAHDRRTYATVGEDLGTWSEAVLASLHGVEPEALAREGWAHSAWRNAAGERSTQVVVPACAGTGTMTSTSTGTGTEGDLHLRVQERGDQIIEVAVLTPPSTDPAERVALLEAFVRRPLGGDTAIDPNLPAPACDDAPSSDRR